MSKCKRCKKLCILKKDYCIHCLPFVRMAALEAKVKALRVGIIKHTALIEMFDAANLLHESIADSGKELRQLALLQDEKG